MQRLRYSADKNRKVRLSRFYSTVFYTADTAQSDFSEEIFYPQKTQRKSRRISSGFKNLELKMHTKNIHTHTRARMNFQERFDRDAEDMCARVITKLSLIFCFSGVFFSTHEREKEKKATTFFQQRKRKKEQPLFSFFLYALFFLVFLSVVCSTLDTFFPFLFLILPLRIPSTVVVVVVVVARRLRRRNTFPSRVSIAVRCSREKRRFLEREKSAQGKRSYILKR